MLGRSALLAATNSSDLPGFGAKYANLTSTLDREPMSPIMDFSPSGDAIVIGHGHESYAGVLSGYSWSNASGFGSTRFSTSKLTGGYAATWVKYPNAGNKVVVGHNVLFLTASPFPFSPSTGFSQLSDITSFTYPIYVSSGGGSFTPGDTAYVFADNGYGYLRAQSWSNSTGWGNEFSKVAISGCSAAKLNPSGNAVVYSTGSSPFIEAKIWSNLTGFGSSYAAPAIPMSAGGILDIAFSPSGDTVFIVNNTLPRIHAYKWSSTTGFGDKYPDPPVPLSDYCPNISVHPSGTAIACSNIGGTSEIKVYRWSSASGFGSRFIQPAIGLSVNPGSTGYPSYVKFSPDGNVLAVCVYQSPYTGGTQFIAQAYKWIT